jgi:hypothetical protein
MCFPFSVPIIPSRSLVSSSTAFATEVIDWLDQNNVQWEKVKDPFLNTTTTTKTTTFPKKIPNTVMLELKRCANDDLSEPPKIWLHIIPSPRKLVDTLPPNFNKKMTDFILSSSISQQQNKGTTMNNVTEFPKKIIHLHEDMWIYKRDIVRCRLLTQIGIYNRRIYGRKLVSKRINATYALNFLDENHLWGATRAKYYYGLLSKDDEELMAVATFSNRRKVTRKDRQHKSHELLRFCTKRDITVIGGITKLMKIFITEIQPDDIVTVIDRDFGDGSGWHSIGFYTVATMPPLPMTVNPDERGIRRHLVGAGIRCTNDNDIGDGGRLGLASNILEELDSVEDSEEATQVLASHSFFTVYDSGVERLIKFTDDSHIISAKDAIEIWENSKPTYTPAYYSPNTGISALLRNAEEIKINE